jgi:hypothetical protein
VVAAAEMTQVTVVVVVLADIVQPLAISLPQEPHIPLPWVEAGRSARNAAAILFLTPSPQLAAVREGGRLSALLRKLAAQAGAAATINPALLERRGRAILAALALMIHIQLVAAVALTQWVLPVRGLPVAQVVQVQRPQLQEAASHGPVVAVVEQHSKVLPEGWAVQAVAAMAQLEWE